jgi:serine/threonine-protein kinase
MIFGEKFRSLLRGKTDVFARYEILREAVSGTMSKFYKVSDRETQKTYGLKVLDKQKTRQLEARFKGLKKPTEGEIAGRFDHPHIVKTIEHGLTTRDEQYVLMEYLEGHGLNSLIVMKEPGLEGNRLTLIRHAATALHAVHEAGFIHRDVCPRNFVVASDLKSLKLIDFGLTVPREREYMLPGNRTGTPAYMSPEVVRRRPTDHRLDIFSFGVTAYELLAFELPWQGGTDGQAAMSHGSIDPTPITDHRPDLDPRLAKTIMRCLDPEPANRPQTMQDLLNEIRLIKAESVESAAE